MQLDPKHKKLHDLLERQQNTDIDSLTKAFVHHLEYTVGKYKYNTTEFDVYQAVSHTMRDTLVDRWNETMESYAKEKAKRVYYLSMEFLLGRLTHSNAINLGGKELIATVLGDFGYDYQSIISHERDAGLGNGGLGRLAACFIDSAATLDLPVIGCGLRYEYGIFHQYIFDGFQKEAPDHWLARGNPWEIQRSDIVYSIGFYGTTETYITPTGLKATKWIPGETINAMGYDILVPGFGTRTVNHLRLWRARGSSEFNFDYFNHGDYMRAVEDQQKSENISRVLYPNENIIQGKELRLKQEFLLVSATLQDAITTFLREEKDWGRLPERMFFQMNDTHPALAIAELIRILVDVHGLEWSYAVALVQQCTAYTNHTVMPEALEKWDVPMISRLLPRHVEIIYLLNFNFIEDLKKKNIPEDKIRKMSIVEEGAVKKIRMANLAIVGSKAVNGVAALHTELLKKDLFREFYELMPTKFQNKTNGITHRRWMVSANPELTRLMSAKIGRDWIRDLDKLKELERFAEDPEFQADWQRIKHRNKEELARIIFQETGVSVDPKSLFDVQIKRIHEYKRQHLNLLRIIGDYQRLKATPSMEYTPRTFIFSGKAAPGYHRAKLIIKLIHAIAEKVNRDPDIAGRMRVAFLPNYSVSLAERVFPASNLSEQISTAGTEASGTGNMKFMLNGALTVGTLDGANIEILEEVGADEIYIFGNTVDEINKIRAEGYSPVSIYEQDPEIKAILDAIQGNYFCPNAPGLFQEIFHSLTYGGDHYLLLSDYHSYVATQMRISRDYRDQFLWTKKSILNTARCGKFSSDRTIREYARDIWEVKPVIQRTPRVVAT